MANTVVGIFEYESDAQQAQNYLLANGFADGDVDIKTASYKSDAKEETVTDRDQDFGDRVGNFFRDLFDGDDDETTRYSEAGKRGTIVTVHAATLEEAEAAAAVLDDFGAIDVNENNLGSTSSDSYIGSEPVTNSGSYIDSEPVTASDSRIGSDSLIGADDVTESDSVFNKNFVAGDESASLPIIEEELTVGKQEIETGGVRLRSRIIQRPVQESIRLRQEQVTINRTPVDRVATDSEFDTFREGTIEMKEYAEIPVVSKEARVVEEVSLNKTVEERDEIISETVRHTEVDVEDLTDEERLRRSGLDL
ncbi:YsnF/AvaK domain-containing protein [Dyadobacter sp. CY343]|uniref:YsnF/AvaK domain-containing protein n=1 Tax=Dyadobacter sp. CY343 TaxID=2907299 RepID=UPI001F28AB57|nr:YsnF/AvaK domain-containing protein [Dyadobacter sp. CY343]MCE7059774.1 YsnF/AvaK domain-containing protein [Dyadobacter sp. CY343]